jgi:Family of unknown function (DUF6584)
VAKQDVLARVKADIALGRTHLARQRLRALLAADPDDLEVRDLLADVYRQAGNPVEAGRWGFLGPGLREDEAVAFARAHPSAWLRLRLLRFTGDPADLAPPARTRLHHLAEEAERVGPPRRWKGMAPAGVRPSRSVRMPCLFVAVAMLVIGALVAVGVYQVVRWLGGQLG